MIWTPVRQRMQSELLKRGHCVGCSRNLADSERKDSIKDRNIAIVQCKCDRVYLYRKNINTYKRARPEDLKYHLK